MNESSNRPGLMDPVFCAEWCRHHGGPPHAVHESGRKASTWPCAFGHATKTAGCTDCVEISGRTTGRETTRCCSRHHYTCAASFDDYPPDPCCPGCPCHPAPMDPLFTTEEAS